MSLSKAPALLTLEINKTVNVQSRTDREIPVFKRAKILGTSFLDAIVATRTYDVNFEQICRPANPKLALTREAFPKYRNIGFPLISDKHPHG